MGRRRAAKPIAAIVRRQRSTRRALSAADGFTMIELLAALLVLTIGILGTYTAFTAAQKLSLVSERHATMEQVAQREIERVEGIAYDQIGLECGGGTGQLCPAQWRNSSNPTDTSNPDYYVSTDGTTFQTDRSVPSSTESLDIDSANGQVVPQQSWTNTSAGGNLSGQIYDFVTWSTDSRCAPGCSASQNYKRIIVAVTVTRGATSLLPYPVYVTSTIADPNAVPAGGTVNGTLGNPLNNPTTTCVSSTGTTGPCTSGINQGTPNTYFLHDWPSGSHGTGGWTNSGTPQSPSASHTTDPTVALNASAGTCATSQAAATAATELGCPVPDLMDINPPAGNSTTPLYQYSTDQCPTCTTTAFPGGRLVQPTCFNGSTRITCTTNGGGTGQASDCNQGSWANTLSNLRSAFWITPPLSSATTFTGWGSLTIYTQTLSGTPANVSLCLQFEDVPGSPADLLVPASGWQPQDLGSPVGYVAPSLTGGGNWPTTPTEFSFLFNFGSNLPAVPAGDRLGVRLWMTADVNNPIDVIYDNPQYPSQLQVNSQ